MRGQALNLQPNMLGLQQLSEHMGAGRDGSMPCIFWFKGEKLKLEEV